MRRLWVIAATAAALLAGCGGSSHPRQDMPRIVDWYTRGLLNIDGLITRRYTLDDINRAYEDLDSDFAGRGVIVF